MDDREHLLSMLEAIEKIENRIRGGFDGFYHDEMLQVWVLHHLQIIGEAASRVSTTLRSAHPEVPWLEIIAMRNVLVHNYFGIDIDEVWDTVKKDVPDLKGKLTAILAKP